MDAKTIRKAIGTVLVAIAAGTAVLSGAPTAAKAESVGETPLYYLENRYTDESMFTVDPVERDTMRSNGWTYVKVSLILPGESASPVYRLYNPYTDDHLFTQDVYEYDELAEYGWQQEGAKFYSDDDESAPMFRLYADWIDGQGSHVYTTSVSYYESQVANTRWAGDGARWYGLRVPTDAYEQFQGLTYPDLDYTGLDDEEVPPAPDAPEVPDEPEVPEVPNAPEDPDVEVVEPGEGRQDVLTYAREWLGWPYVSSGESPEEGGFDCSGLTYFVFDHFGVELPRTTYDQIAWLKEHGTWTTDVDQLRPGDLIAMSGGGHVAIYVGKDPATGLHMMIDAPHPGEVVQERELYAVYDGTFLGGGSVF